MSFDNPSALFYAQKLLEGDCVHINQSFTILGCLLITGCVILKPTLPLDTVSLPTTYSTPALAESTVAETAWWLPFNNPELNELIQHAMIHNPSLEQVWARLTQADATAKRLGAARLPSINLTGGFASTESVNTGADNDQWNVGVAATSYELDLWGRVNAVQAAAKLDAESARFAVETAAMSLSAEVANRWNNLIARRMELAILREQLKANRTSLELIELRFRRSFSTGLAVLQQRQTVESTAALIPLAERAERAAELELTALLGQTEPVSIESNSLCTLPPLPALGIPATLLEQRPDVQRARALLDAASWRVAAARADRLPAIRLSGRIESTEGNAEELFDNWLSTLIGSLSAPLIDAGGRHAETERTQAVLRESIAAYRATVIQAINEVEQALNLEETQANYAAALEVRHNAAKQAYDESLKRYRNGAIDYTTVLFQLNTLQQIERLQISAQADQISYRINLLRSLGGNWVKQLEEPGESNEEN